MEITNAEINRLSDIVSALLTKHQIPEGIDFGGLTFDMAYKSKLEALANIPVRQEQKCNVYYDGCHTEYMMWMLG